MLVDVHAHYGRWPYPEALVSAGEMVAAMRRYGISYTFVSSTLAIYYDFVDGNRETAEAIRDFPELLAYVTVNLNYLEESLAEIGRYLGPEKRGGDQFVGIKGHPLTNHRHFETPGGMAITRAAAQYGVPILIHTLSSPVESPWHVVPAAKAYPGVPIILGHMGGDTWWEGVRVGQQSPNLYLEICSSYTDPNKLRAGIDGVGAERVLFGTDSTMFDPAHMLGAMEDAELTSDERTLVMGANAQRLFNLSEPGAG
jgi:uncharacterized protein